MQFYGPSIFHVKYSELLFYPERERESSLANLLTDNNEIPYNVELNGLN